MDENKPSLKQSLFHIERDNQQITTISPLSKVLPEQLHILDYLLQFVDLVTLTLQQEDTTGVIYYCPIPAGKMEYAQLFNQFSSSDSTASTLKSLILKTLAWKELNKPIVSIFTDNCTAIALATMLWADYRISCPKLKFGFPESKYGLFTGFGSTVYLPSLIGNSATLNFLTQGKLMNSEEAYKLGLIDEVTERQDEDIFLAKNWILRNPLLIPGNETKQIDQVSPEAILSVQKKAHGLYPGTNAVIELVKKRTSSTPIQAIEQEVTLYLEVINRPEPLHMIRTLYYGVQNAQSPNRIQLRHNYSLNKIGILGAGMMGSGIAYEAARVGIEVVLKDVTIAQAERGKAYSTQLCEKLLAMGILNQSQQEQLLSRIKPTEKVGDLNGSDCIIEAVFEDFSLKAAVTQESLPYLSDNGFFASNTTSLPITELAKAAHDAKSFIGMHSFSRRPNAVGRDYLRKGN
jgi:3-hydroxyacyl-CoA dehydrogenase